MSFLIAVLMMVLGVIYITPGALPVAANQQVFLSRLSVGFGFIVCAVALCMDEDDMLMMGLLIISGGHGVAAWAIHQQPCAQPPENRDV